MKKTLLFVLIFIVLFRFSVVYAQTNLSNINVYDLEDYKIAEQYRLFAIEAQEDGNYDKSIEFSKSGLEYAQSVLAYSSFLTLAYRAENSRIKALEGISMFKSIGGETNTSTDDLYVMALSNQNLAMDYIKMAGENTSDIETYSNNFSIAIDNFKKTSGISETGYNLVIVDNKRSSLVSNSIIIMGDDADTIISNFIDESVLALNNEDYPSSLSKSKEALDFLSSIEDYFNASSLYTLAQKTLDGAKNAGKDKSYSDEYNRASGLLDTSKSYLDKKDYDNSIKDSQGVLAIVEKMGGITTALPKYYKVVSRPKRTDSLWSISAYDFVYGDGMYWYILYNANRQKLKNPKNPNLILPGQILVIPSLMGEVREGLYDPAKEYGSIKRK